MLDQMNQWIAQNGLYGLLVFVRMSGLFLVSPVFGHRRVPAMLKAGLSLLLTVIVVPLAQPQIDLTQSDTLVYLFMIVMELMVGAILGLMTLMFFSVALVAGQVVDLELGLGIGNLFDPQMETPASMTGVLFNLLLTLYFLLSDGHLRLIAILAYSLEKIPIGQVHLNPAFAQWVGQQFSLSFSLAVSLMLPFIAAALLTESGMGILSRAIPQLNAYMVGLPLKILVGLSVLLLIQPLFLAFCDRLFSQMFTAAEQAVLGMGGVT